MIIKPQIQKLNKIKPKDIISKPNIKLKENKKLLKPKKIIKKNPKNIKF
jgi:hypothetical protein